LALDVGLDIGVALVVDPRDLLLPVRDDAHLLDCRPCRVGHQAVRRDAILSKQRSQPRCCLVVSDDADQRDLCAERRQVLRHVCGAAQPRILPFEPDDGDRGFR
jgi:hypothetical protein